MLILNSGVNEWKKESEMGKAKFSDGVTVIEGKTLQKAFIKTTTEFYVCCPYCGAIIDCGDEDQILECSSCKKKFFAEFSFPNIL
jgi:hypothetical protein